MYKAGIIGFGKMGMLHGALLSGSRKARIAAICDKSAVMRLGFKRVYKDVHTYDDAKKMLDREKLDIVIVTTPTFNHEESVVMALESGCAVFVEKPLAITAEQARRIWKLSTEKKLPVQVGFCNRFFPSVSKAQELLKQNIIGSVEHVHAVMFIGDVFEEHTGWRYKPELSGGGALMDFGIHMIDLLICFFGPIDTVEGETKRIYSQRVEDEASAKIKFRSGVCCDFGTSWSKEEFRKSYSRMEIQGEAGRLVVTDQTLEIFGIHGERTAFYTYPDLYQGCFMDLGGLLFSYQMECFLKRVEGTAAAESGRGCTPAQALYVQRTIEAIYQSAEEKRVMKVSDYDTN